MNTTLYQHPNGHQISFDGLTNTLHITDGENQIVVPIGPIGLAELGNKLVAIGHDCEVAK
jgi:hypothetical protein